MIPHIIHEGIRCLLCASDRTQYERNAETVKSAYDTKIVRDRVVNDVKTVFLMQLLCNRYCHILPEILIKKEVKCTVLVLSFPFIVYVHGIRQITVYKVNSAYIIFFTISVDAFFSVFPNQDPYFMIFAHLIRPHPSETFVASVIWGA